MLDTALIALIAIGLVAWLWTANLRARETATGICVDTCQRLQIQLLDETVALDRIRLAREDNGRVALERSYQFDYISGMDLRRRGELTLRGLRLVRFTLDTPD